MTQFNILAILQGGRLAHEAVLLAASLRAAAPEFAGTLYLAEPQPGPLWPPDPGPADPRLTDPAHRALLESLGACIVPFQNAVFGASYPQGNKIEALAVLPDAPFLFLDTDTLVLGNLDAVPFDFARPSASMRREGTWPQVDLYGPDLDAIWGALYAKFGLDYAASLDLAQPAGHWTRNLYFNAGWFFAQSPRAFGDTFLRIARAIRDDPPRELMFQALDPWLDQVALPLAIHAHGGGRPGPELRGMDGGVTCHWRTLPLLYARESDAAVAMVETVAAAPPVRAVLARYAPFRKLIYQGDGARIRAMFDRTDLPRREQAIRNAIKRAGLWAR
jgi:hypothetical protein